MLLYDDMRDELSVRRIAMAFYRLKLQSAFFHWGRCLLVSCFVICSAYAQTPDLDQEVRVNDLPPLTARSAHASDVLATSLEIVFNDREVCCGKNSALEYSVQSSDPKSLKDIAQELQGRHLLSDGRPIIVTAEYLTPNQITAGHLIYILTEKHTPLMMWNSQVYVVDGVTYVAVPFDGGITYFLHKFLLQDSRFSDSRREVLFDRVIEDAGEVQGLLFLQVAPPA
jgi:hypothetical protein